MSTPNFRFKQFTVWHDQCAMKVGTDGVLLGAWCPITDNPSTVTHILDVGTGSGLVALMMAQRCPEAQIDAIDIDEVAVNQAKENFQNSVFSHQLSAFKHSLQEWSNLQSPITNNQSAITNHPCYDLIVSNPPYFQNSLKNPDKGRELARHTDSLPFEELMAHSARLLKEDGQLALILPAEAEQEIRTIAARHSLYCTRVTRVYSKETKPARRVLLAFSRQPSAVSPIEDTLVLENEIGGRSAAYSELCKEFYL